jgi:hypothetical protein
VLQDEQGRWWVTHAGLYAGGLWIAPLRWRAGAGS